jgi:RNA polymerase sigma-70 factor (ECF subfamily)
MPVDATDEQLLARFAKGDQPALGELARRHEPALYGLARAMLARRDDLARDALQEAWVRVIRSARHFRADSSVRTWLYRIVINRCHDLRAAAQRNNPATLNGVELPAPSPAAEPFPDEALHKALDTLPESARLILLLCHHRGLTNEQAAEVLGIPVGTLKSRQHAAMLTLRETLAHDGVRP